MRSRFHEKKFHWKPWDRTTVLLKDFSDYGNAGARASPNNAVLLDVAPLSLSMETFTPGERFFTLDNHELAHVATMDVWNSRDAFWRQFLPGKPMPIQEHPESILYNFLATPRVNVPRWYLEGSAVFFETWMAGGLGRAQGGYDEMVFRAKVRDDDSFYSPLGLETEGIAVDFQVGVNDYLYGTRFFSYLALTYGPDKAVEWLRRGEDSKAFYAAQFKHVFGKPLDDVWSDWIAFEHEFQKANLAKLAQYPLTEVDAAQPERPRLDVARLRRREDQQPDRRVPLSRHDRLHRTHGPRHRQARRKLQELKGMMLYQVTSVAFDPDARTAYYTEDNYAFRDLIAVNVDTGKKRMLLQGRAHRRHGLQPGRQVDLGDSPPERLCDDRPDPAALCRLQPDPHVQLRRRSRSTSTSRPTARCCRPRSARSTASRRCACGSSTNSSRTADPVEVARLALAALDARRLRLRARRQDAVRHVLLHRRLERLPLRHRHAEIRRGQQCLDRLLPADPAARRIADRLRI